MPDSDNNDTVQCMATNEGWGRGAVAAGHTGDFVFDPATGVRSAVMPQPVAEPTAPPEAQPVAGAAPVNSEPSAQPKNQPKKGA
jgi:hypothetical protein